MNRAVKFAVVGVVLILQLLFLRSCNPWPHGDIVDMRYRQKERLQALADSKLHPSPTSQAVVIEELKRMRRYERAMIILLLGLLAILNGLGGYYLFGHGQKTLGVSNGFH